MLDDPRQLSGLLGIPFSDEQLAAIAAPLDPCVIIAGAGSGKTTVMAARVVWLVGSGQVRREQVLGLTFTRKAAAELAARVAAARAVWLVGSGQVRREQVLGLTFTRKAAAELAARVAAALVACRPLFGGFAAPCGAPGGVVGHTSIPPVSRRTSALPATQPDTAHFPPIMGDRPLETAGVGAAGPHDSGIHTGQQEAGFFPADAGPDGFYPDHADPVAADPDATETILTYDAFAGRIVDDYGLYLGVEPDTRLITGAARFQLAARVVADASGPFPALGRFSPRTVTRRVLELSSQLRSHLAEPDAVEAQARRFWAELDAAPFTRTGRPYAKVAKAKAAVAERLELLRLVRDYEAAKADLGRAEFADQMAWAARLAVEAPGLAASVRREFRVVLLDEYQDTSAAQAVLLRRLFSGDDAAGGRGHSVTAVGDPCQAIYGWRGAATSNILSFAAQFPCADGSAAASYSLRVNRRSGPRILAAANELAGGLGGAELVAPDGTPPGEVGVTTFDTWPDELGWLAGEVARLHDTGRVQRWSDIAVLARRNEQVADVHAELLARDIPAEVVGVGGLLDVPAVADVVATLQVLDDPGANPAVVRLLTSPRWAIGMDDLAALGARARELAQADEPASPSLPAGQGEPSAHASLLEAVADPGDAVSEPARRRCAQFAAEVAGLRRWATGSLTELVAQVVAVLRLDIELRVRGQSRDCLEAFSAVVADFAGGGAGGVGGVGTAAAAASLSGLLAYLDDEREEGVGLEQPQVSRADAVKVLTVHKAKGLEWPVVFVPGLVRGVFPASRVSTFLSSAAAIPAELRGDAAAVPQVTSVTNAGLEAYADQVRAEQRLAEDRLAYVAVTRAREALLASTHRWAAGAVKPRDESPYLRALRDVGWVVGRPVSQANPLLDDGAAIPWPDLGDPDAFERRLQAAKWVRAGMARDPSSCAQSSFSSSGVQSSFSSSGVQSQDPLLLAELTADDRADYDRWREWARALVGEARAAQARRNEVALPGYLSVTALASAARDPAGFAARAAHPAPRLVDGAAHRGVDVHRWLESRLTTAPTLDDELDDRDVEVPERLAAAFDASPFAALVPVAVEAPFTLTLAGRVIRGRIDAVFPGGDARRGCQAHAFQVVDWKTGDADRADPLQLACYRLAWAELRGVDVDAVDAVFYDLAHGHVVRPATLPGRAEIEALVAGLGA